MASKTRKTKVIRKHKRARQGNKTKSARRTLGSTKSPAVLFGDE